MDQLANGVSPLPFYDLPSIIQFCHQSYTENNRDNVRAPEDWNYTLANSRTQLPHVSVVLYHVFAVMIVYTLNK